MGWPSRARWSPRVAEKPPDPLLAGDPGCLRIEIMSGVLKEAMKRSNKLLAMSRGLE
ncbi:hypothetical protein LEMLEM_LOCUS18344 [Lemmus lemmus]